MSLQGFAPHWKTLAPYRKVSFHALSAVFLKQSWTRIRVHFLLGFQNFARLFRKTYRCERNSFYYVFHCGRYLEIVKEIFKEIVEYLSLTSSHMTFVFKFCHAIGKHSQIFQNQLLQERILFVFEKLYPVHSKAFIYLYNLKWLLTKWHSLSLHSGYHNCKGNLSINIKYKL